MEDIIFFTHFQNKGKGFLRRINMLQNFRRNSGLTQRIYLVKLRIDEEEDSYIFDVLGTSSKLYEVTISETKTVCTCPDHVYRKIFCKHMYFLTERVISLEVMQLRLTNIAQFKEQLLQKLGHLQGNEIGSETRNDTCVICFEDFIVSDVLQTCYICKNSLHGECWERYCGSGRSQNCVYCRTPVKQQNHLIMKNFVVK